MSRLLSKKNPSLVRAINGIGRRDNWGKLAEGTFTIVIVHEDYISPGIQQIGTGSGDGTERTVIARTVTKDVMKISTTELKAKQRHDSLTGKIIRNLEDGRNNRWTRRFQLNEEGVLVHIAEDYISPDIQQIGTGPGDGTERNKGRYEDFHYGTKS